MATTDHEERDGRVDSLHRLRSKLHIREPYIENEELRRAIMTWLQEVDKFSSGDLLDHIESHLSSIRRREVETDEEHTRVEQYPMRRPHDSGMTDRERHFPDSCKGCPHYGTRCPVFTDPTVQRQRERLQNELRDAGHTQTLQEYDRFAEDHQCHQIVAAIQEFEEIGELLDVGWELYMEVEQLVDVGPVDPDQAVIEQVRETLERARRNPMGPYGGE